MIHRVQVTDTSQHLHPLLKDTNNKKRLAWAKKHEQWTLDRWKSVLWSGAQIVRFDAGDEKQVQGVNI